MNIIKNPFVYRLLKSRFFIFLLRLPSLLAFIFIIASGLFGGVYRNFNNLTVGVLWLVFISFTAIIGGKIWCLVCPWNTLAEWFQGMFRIPHSELRIPKLLRNLWLPIFLFLLIIWLEYATALTDNARLIAYLALIIFGITFVSALLFSRKSFCRYGCPVGAICGLYGLFAPLELRSADKNTCQACLTKDCIKGNEKGAPCPVFEYPGTMDDNLNCILCTECVRTCPNDNIALNIRPPAADLLKFRLLSFSEIFMIATMLALSIFGAINISMVHLQIIDWALLILPIPETIFLLLLMFLLIALLMLIFYLLSAISKVKLSTVVYIFLPIALFNHMANTLKLLNIRIEEVMPLISDPLGLSWNLFGTAGHLAKPFLDAGTLQYIAGPVMIIGLLYSIYLSYRLVRTTGISMFYALCFVSIMFGLVAFNWWLIPR